MNTIEKPVRRKKPHVGNNIAILRRMKGMNQHDLATAMKVKEQTLSDIENSEEIDDIMLERVAQALGVPAEIIKNYDHDNSISFISTNYGTMGDGSSLNVSNNENVNYNITNPIDKVTELYERLLSEQREKYEKLKNQLDDMASELIEVKNRR